MLSSTAGYALRAILVLARDPGRAVRSDAIAAETGAPRNYMAKTLNALTRAGLVTSARGPRGGFTLALAPETLTVAQVVDCFDPPRPQRGCLLRAGPCAAGPPCVAHRRWTQLEDACRDPLARTTVADLLAG